MNRMIFIFSLIVGTATAATVPDGLYEIVAGSASTEITPYTPPVCETCAPPHPCANLQDGQQCLPDGSGVVEVDVDVPPTFPPDDPCSTVEVDFGYRCEDGDVIPDCPENPPAGQQCTSNGELEPIPDDNPPVDTPPVTDFGVVYSRSLRNVRTATLKGYPVSANAISNWDVMPDTARIWSGMQEADLVYVDEFGKLTVIYDCVSSAENCAALDGRVSPDGTKIAFWVVRSAEIQDYVWTIYGNVPNRVLRSVQSAKIYIYDIASGVSTLVDMPGSLNMHPEWISNDKLIFVSNRDKRRPVWLADVNKGNAETWALQRYTANIDGSNAVNIGPHDDVALHPFVLSDGNILTSMLRIDEKRGYGTVTIPNEYWVTETDQFGGGEFTVLGAHGKNMPTNQGTQNRTALHFYGERSKGEILTADYYRRNHANGAGQVWMFPRLPHGVEGVGETLFPDITVVNPYGQEGDNITWRDPVSGQFGGKMAQPVGLPDGNVMMSYGHGFCYAGLKPENANDEYLNGGPGCDMGIYRTTAIPSKHPSDLVKIVDDPEWHEFSPDIVRPYQAIYGKPMPDQQVQKIQRDENGESFCTLEVVDARLFERFPSGGKACWVSGPLCVEAGFSVPRDLASLAIYEMIPNKRHKTDLKKAGEPIPLDGHESRYLGKVDLEEDGSINVVVPCDTPIKMRGMDKDGTVFVRDQIKHSLRSGEARRCIGCHGGHTEQGYYAKGGMEAFDLTIAASKPAQALQPTLTLEAP